MIEQMRGNHGVHQLASASVASDSGRTSAGCSSSEYWKWKNRMQRGIEAFISEHPNTFQRRIRRGIPAEFRWKVWKAAVGLKDVQSTHHKDTYQSLHARENCWSRLITIDISRTFPENADFTADQQACLWRILNAYANLNEDVGYCQGMNYIAGLLLIVSKSECEAFWMFMHLMENGKLNELYKEKFPLLHRYLRAFDLLMAEQIPELREHFITENVVPAVYLHQWFLTLFIKCLPFDTVLVMWDVIICDGPPVILPITVALLKILQNCLMNMNFEGIVKFLKSLKVGDDEVDGTLIAKLLIKQSESIDIPPHILRELRSSEPQMLASFQFDVAPGSSTSSEAMSGGWFLKTIPEDRRLHDYYDFL